jgi:hypothetical protein
MARETKQDRIVRTLIDQTTEHLHEMKSIELNIHNKEADIEVWAQSFLKNCLGYTVSAGYTIRSQEAKGKLRPDLVVQKSEKPVFIVEVKKFGFDLDKSDFRSGKVQLAQYLSTVGNVPWGMLTNGCEWRLFDFSNPSVGGIEIARFDLKEDNENYELNKKIIEETCYSFIDFHESTFSSESWSDLSKEATAFSPESIAKAILSTDVVKYIAKTIRGEHEYKANFDVLTDKIYSVLQEGLNDAIPDWNEAKVAEYQKYIKAQKRASRKTRRSPKKESLGTSEVPPQANPEQSLISSPSGEKEISLVSKKVG